MERSENSQASETFTKSKERECRSGRRAARHGQTFGFGHLLHGKSSYKGMASTLSPNFRRPFGKKDLYLSTAVFRKCDPMNQAS